MNPESPTDLRWLIINKAMTENDVREWHKNGKEKYFCAMSKSGRKHGHCMRWWNNGKHSYAGYFEHGRREGGHFYFHKNGNIQREIYYKNGVKHGRFVDFYKNGGVNFVAEYRNGKRISVRNINNRK